MSGMGSTNPVHDTTLGQPKQTRHTLRWVVISVVVVLAVASATAAGYLAHFSDKGLPGASIAGTPITGKVQTEISAIAENSAKNVTVTVDLDGKPTVASLDELGISVDANATAASALTNNTSIGPRFAALFKPQTVQTVYSVDQKKLDAFSEALVDSLGQRTKDAGVVLGTDGTFQVVPAVIGRGIDTKPIKDAAEKAASTLGSQTVEIESKQVEPAVSTEQATDIASQANAKANDVSLTLRGTYSVNEATVADAASMITIPKTDSGLGSPVFDPDKVKAWVAKVAESTNDAPVSGINNLNPDGSIAATASLGTPGWKANNVDQIASDVQAALASGESYDGQFTYDEVPQGMDTMPVVAGAENLAYSPHEGEKWIDVNLSEHTMTAYEGATVVYGPIPMVNGQPGWETITGTYRIQTHLPKQDMGCTPGWPYCTKDVPWIMYFSGNFALHGAPWRTSFGFAGSGGSHGCVNLPVDSAKWIYDWAPDGTPVVSHR